MGRRTLVLIVALLLAGVAAFAVWQVLSNAEDAAREKREYQIAYRAVLDIPEGTDGALSLQQQRVVLSEVETQFLPPDAIVNEQQLNDVLIGRVAAGPISAGQVLTVSQWAQITADIRPLREIIPQGKQAMTVAVDQVAGVGGFITPGDRVNMIISIAVELNPDIVEDAEFGSEAPEVEDTTGAQETTVTKEISRFVLQGLPVLAVGTELRREEGAPQVVDVGLPAEEGEEEPDLGNRGLVTLEVTPEEAERIAYSFSNGEVWLTIVPEDFVPVPTDGVTIENLWGADYGILSTLFPRLETLENLLRS